MSGDRYTVAILLRRPRKNWNIPSISDPRYTENETYLQNLDQQYEPSKYNEDGAFKFSRKKDHYESRTHTTGAVDRYLKMQNDLEDAENTKAYLNERNEILRTRYLSMLDDLEDAGNKIAYLTNRNEELKERYSNMQDDLDDAENKIAYLIERYEELRERNLELQNGSVDSDEETSDSDDTNESLREQ